MNQVSQCPSHDTGKLAHGDKLASSVICSESLVDDSDSWWPIIRISESWGTAELGMELCPDWGAAPACDR